MHDKQKLRWFQEMGVDTILEATPINRTAPRAVKQPITKENISLERQLASACEGLDALKQAVLAYDGCLLKKAAINTVFADGNPQSDVMFIGEAPGASEDEKGIPFCGQSGKLLDNIILALGYARADVYISNTIFWRPPGNRRPTPQELLQCQPFVEKHIALVQPKLLVLVGSTAVESLLNKKIPMNNVRRQFFPYNNEYLAKPIPAYVIFHPSYLLRQPARKKDMWFDIINLRNKLEQ